MAQAIACAEAGATLISPFVGRIMDFYKAEEIKNDPNFMGYEPSSTDPGVISVTEIYHYYKKHGYNTIVMGASFRNVNEIIELVGCDRLTIAPGLIEELQKTSVNVTIGQKLNAMESIDMDIDKIDVDEKSFRMMQCMNAMATQKLAEGIRGFAADIVKLEAIIKAKIAAA
jgi:transaldolase